MRTITQQELDRPGYVSRRGRAPADAPRTSVRAVCPSCEAVLQPHREAGGWLAYRCKADPEAIPVIHAGSRVFQGRRAHRSYAWMREAALTKPSPEPDGPTAQRVRIVHTEPSPLAVHAICMACGRRPALQEGGYYRRYRCQRHPWAPILFAVGYSAWTARGWHIPTDNITPPAYLGVGTYSQIFTHEPDGRRR